MNQPFMKGINNYEKDYAFYIRAAQLAADMRSRGGIG